MSKVRYLLNSTLRSFDGRRWACPNCGRAASVAIERKYVVTSLRRCSACYLMFRAPTDDPSENDRFYNDDYEQGFTTATPSQVELEHLKSGGFASTEKDYSKYIGVLRALGVAPGARLFDFGCSWGYGSYQFAEAGYKTTSFEISARRADYARTHLGVDAQPNFDLWAAGPDAQGSQDVFFSAHVLEHVPSPSRVIEQAQRVLKAGGLFVAFFPNGSAGFRAASPNWSLFWGQVHPNFLDDVYLNHALEDCVRLFGASPVRVTTEDTEWLADSRRPAARYLDGLAGDEMFVAARRL
jgi:SAM-dependent methyltransferase